MNKLLLITVVVFSGCLFSLDAQKYDFNWLLGYGITATSVSGDFGITLFDFNQGNLIVKPVPQCTMDFIFVNSIISNREGKLLYYSNGEFVENGLYQRIIGAQKLSRSSNSYQAILFLPHPDGSDRYMLFFSRDTGGRVDPSAVYNNVDERYFLFSNENNPQEGELVFRDSIILIDTLADGRQTACRHANGRDWWILMPERNSFGYYKILVDVHGPRVIGKQILMDRSIEGVTQVTFSPDGRYYATQITVSATVGAFTLIYEFDRCSGDLTLIAKQNIPGRSSSAGISFSPDSKLLYYSVADRLYQCDLNASDILASSILLDSIDVIPRWGLNYDKHLLAPDGKIYINSKFASPVMHVINFPNLRGKDCQLIRSGIDLTFNNGISNMPFYRLGPIDGSTCDTLGINNNPWAWWRYDQDSTEHLKIQFVDASAYEVEEWYWDFDDGITSSDTSPLHTYSKNGVYEVCLIVKNKNGADTLCRTLYIGVVSNSDPNKNMDFQLFPNPCTSVLIINVNDYLPSKMLMTIYNLEGTEVLHKRLYQGSNVIDVEGLNSGVYVVQIKEQGIIVRSEKLVKM
ncbi:MAG: PKD domain-containing protein [Saprospiraceae bacterium]|jgi:hypothetical protein|nr:PKD domain-containing protein [Saprospiraceae bacterium]